MQPCEAWTSDAKFIEIGVRDAEIGLGLHHAGCRKYLGVSMSATRIERIQQAHPELAHQLTAANRPRLVSYNNADVLILSGVRRFFVWKYRSVRHAQAVAWRLDFSLFCLVALVGCLFHCLSKRYTWPRLVTLHRPDGKTRRLLVTQVLKRKICRRQQLHFLPHELGIARFFQQFHARGVRYVVLRWWEELLRLKPNDDIDLLIADESLPTALAVFESLPGILCCDVYSETGLARSQYCGTPYYPERAAERILASAVLYDNLCMTPGPSEHFHSLAYHAVYHKSFKSGLSAAGTKFKATTNPGHDFTGLLGSMAAKLGIRVDISLVGLHDYLLESGWGPSDELLARMATSRSGNRWLKLLASRLEPHFHDQGLAVFVLRKTALDHGFRNRMLAMLAESGFEILATKELSAAEAEYASTRTRGGTWGSGVFEQAGGPPAMLVVAYDPNPLKLSLTQRSKFPERSNARIFVKEKIRRAVNAELPREQSCNALHSSDHAAEAWHLIEVMAPELMDEIRNMLRPKVSKQMAPQSVRRAA